MFKTLKQKVEGIKEYNGTIFLSAFFLLSFIFFNIFLSTLFFIFKVSINASYVAISFILSALLNIYFMKKKNMFDEKKFINSAISILMPILIIIFSIFINGKVLDYTWDGNSYQKATVGLLASGWNPLYEHLEDFDSNSEVPINIQDESPVYINHYARASNIFAANIYKFTGNIEAGKSINTISIIMIFLFTTSFLLYKNKSLLFTLMFSICVATYPVICAQFLTNYLDLLVYVFLYLIIFSFFIFEEKNFIFTRKEVTIPFFMLLTIAINIKFSLFAFAGLYCLAYYLWYIYRLIKNKIDKNFFIHFTITAVVSVLVGVLIVGAATYPKNLIDHGNPFYPLMGDGNTDIMTVNQPAEFNDKSPFEKFFIATFSRSADIYATSDETTKLKIPFSFDGDELHAVSAPDTRIGGNGVLFSGILILSILVIVFLTKSLYNKNPRECVLFLIPLCVTILMTIFLGEAWWARYFPQIYLFVLFAIILLNSKDDKSWMKALGYMLMIIVLINNMITFVYAVRRSYINNVAYNMEFQNFEEQNAPEEATLEVYTDSFHGAKYNVLDRAGNYNVIFINGYSEDKTDVGTLFGGKVEWRYIK